MKFTYFQYIIVSAVMTNSTTLFSRLPSSIWFSRILPQLDHQSRSVFACICQESHRLINNYCGTFVGHEKGSYSKPSREVRSIQLKTEDQKIVGYQTLVSHDYALAVAMMKGDLQPEYIVNGIESMLSYSSLRSMEFINTALLTTDITISLLDNLPAVKTFVFDGCIGIVPSLLFEYMRNNPDIICHKTIKYAPSFNTGGLGTFRSWAGKAHMFWAALLAIYMPVIMDVSPQLMEENSIFFQAMIRILSEAHTRDQVIHVLHALKTAAIESPPDFIREYGMDKTDMEDEGNDYDDDDDILTKRLSLMTTAASHAYFIPVRRLNEIAYLLAPQEHLTIMTSGNSAGRRFHPCDEHGPLPGCMFQGVNLQHEKNDNNQCLVCNIQEEWNNFVCYNATSRDFRETQRRFDQFVDDGGLMPRPVPVGQALEVEKDDIEALEDPVQEPESIHLPEEQDCITQCKAEDAFTEHTNQGSSSLNDTRPEPLDESNTPETIVSIESDIPSTDAMALYTEPNSNKGLSDPPPASATALPLPDFYPLSLSDFPEKSHSRLRHYFDAPENVSKLAERLCNTYCPFSILGTDCPLPHCTKKPLCAKKFGTCGCLVGGHEIGPPCSSTINDTKCWRRGCEKNHDRAVLALARIVGEMHVAGLDEEVWDGRVVFEEIDVGWMEYGREWVEDEDEEEESEGNEESEGDEESEESEESGEDDEDDDAWSTTTQISISDPLYS